MLKVRSRALPILFIVALGVIIVGVAYFISQHTGASGRRAIATRVNFSELRILELKAVEDPVLHGYAYEKNEYRTIRSIAGERLNTMVGGQLPAFEFKKFKFVILCKRINFSWGVAYGIDSPPECPAEFTFEPLHDGLWIWTLDLDHWASL